MRPDRMTTKSQEAFRAASEIAARKGNPEIVPEHLVLAMLDQEGGIRSPIANLVRRFRDPALA